MCPTGVVSPSRPDFTVVTIPTLWTGVRWHTVLVGSCLCVSSPHERFLTDVLRKPLSFLGSVYKDRSSTTAPFPVTRVVPITGRHLLLAKEFYGRARGVTERQCLEGGVVSPPLDQKSFCLPCTRFRREPGDSTPPQSAVSTPVFVIVSLQELSTPWKVTIEDKG